MYMNACVVGSIHIRVGLCMCLLLRLNEIRKGAIVTGR